MSQLCTEDDLADGEIAALAMALLFAGFETSVVKIWHLIVQLLSAPTQWQALLEDPSLIPKATEELMRSRPGSASREERDRVWWPDGPTRLLERRRSAPCP